MVRNKTNERDVRSMSVSLRRFTETSDARSAERRCATIFVEPIDSRIIIVVINGHNNVGDNVDNEFWSRVIDVGRADRLDSSTAAQRDVGAVVAHIGAAIVVDNDRIVIFVSSSAERSNCDAIDARRCSDLALGECSFGGLS